MVIILHLNCRYVGWVKKTVGTGGRAGRVHYETLVAASSMTGMMVRISQHLTA